jgi:hypothetical protein
VNVEAVSVSGIAAWGDAHCHQLEPVCAHLHSAVCRLRGTPLDVEPGTYSFPLSVSSQGASGVGSLSGVVTVLLCVQSASAYTPPYFVSAVDPVVIARTAWTWRLACARGCVPVPTPR